MLIANSSNTCFQLLVEIKRYITFYGVQITQWMILTVSLFYHETQVEFRASVCQNIGHGLLHLYNTVSLLIGNYFHAHGGPAL